jgi:C4-dicarboxylate-specific signal transduction histidine kinase
MDKVLAVSFDCTERRNGQTFAEQQRNHLAHVTRVATLGQLGASLSHEIMQPLTAILSNAQAAKHHLSHEKVDLFELNNILNDVIADDRRAAEIVHHLRGMVRKSTPNLATVALPDVVREVADLLHSDFVQRGVTLNLEIAPDLPAVQGDRVQLQQVMLNLLMNAADAVAPNPVPQRMVWVRTSLPSPMTVELMVADRGAGFTAERMATAFAPFQSSKPNGLGIGLWISRAIIENHLGQISLSNHLMGGAVVTISLPASRVAAPISQHA